MVMGLQPVPACSVLEMSPCPSTTLYPRLALLSLHIMLMETVLEAACHQEQCEAPLFSGRGRNT